jgi:hypothetical protein
MIQKTIHTPNRGQVSISGSFAMNGATPNIVSDIEGTGFTVTYSANGDFIINLTEPAMHIVAILPAVSLAATDDVIALVTAPTLTSLTTGLPEFHLVTYDLSGTTATNKAGRLHFECILSKVA